MCLCKCLFTSNGCTMCTCWSFCRRATWTKIMYVTILFVGTVMSSFSMLSYNFAGLTDWIATHSALLCRYKNLTNSAHHKEICGKIIGLESTYRIGFALFIFFSLFSLLTINIKNSLSFRAGLHNGYWLFKILFLIGLLIGAFQIGSQSKFENVFAGFALPGACVFIIIQFISVLDFIHRIAVHNVTFLTRKLKVVFIIACIFIFYSFAFTMVVYYFTTVDIYSQPQCYMSRIYVLGNFGVCILLSILSVTPCSSSKHPNYRVIGACQSAVITAYVMFLTILALFSDTNQACNPEQEMMHQIYRITATKRVSTGNVFEFTTIMSLIVYSIALVITAFNRSNKEKIEEFLVMLRGLFGKSHQPAPIHSASDQHLTVSRPTRSLSRSPRLSPCISVTKLSRETSANMMSAGSPKSAATIVSFHSQKMYIINKKEPASKDESSINGESGIISLTPIVRSRIKWDDELSGVIYSYTYLHVTCLLGSCLMLMTVTRWKSPQEPLTTEISPAAMWIKIVCSWLCIVIYAWGLFSPNVWQDDPTHIAAKLHAKAQKVQHKTFSVHQKLASS